MGWLERFWRRVVDYKEETFSRNAYYCRTFWVPVHRMLRYIRPYRYISALALGPDDEMWEEIGIPYVPSRWLDGSIDFENPLHLSDKMRSEHYGKVFGTYEGRTPVMVISDPEMIKEVLKDPHSFTHRRVFLCGNKMHDNMLPMIEGPKWRNLRSLLMARFSLPGDIERSVPLIMDCVRTCIRGIHKLADQSGLVERGVKTFGGFTLDLMGRIMFGKPLEGYENPDNLFTKNALKLLMQGREDIMLDTLRYTEFRKKPEYCPFDPEAMEFFKQYIIESLKETTEPEATNLLRSLEKAQREGRITRNDVYANSTILMVLAYYSAALIMAVTCWEISRNEEMQNKLVEEIDSCMKEHGGLTYKAIKKLKYLEQVICEAMRKYPPGVRIERVCYREKKIKDILIKQGTVVAVPLFTLHRDPVIYPEPQQFKPERFASDGANNYGYGYNYLPFGDGNRKCIASQFALVEMKAFLASLLSELRLSPSDDEGPLVFQSKKNILWCDKISFKVKRK